MLSGKIYLKLCISIDMEYRHTIINELQNFTLVIHINDLIDIHFGYNSSVVIFYTMVNSYCENGMNVQTLGFSTSVLLSARIRPDEKCGPEHYWKEELDS